MESSAAPEKSDAGQVSGSPEPWSRITFAPPDAWTEPELYDVGLQAKEGTHVTHLLWMRQVNFTEGKTFHSIVTRLETALGVQHHSQWQLDLNTRSQRLTLHWVRIVRAGQLIDHLHRNRMRALQRETQLDHLVISGNWTLLLVLDDVRPATSWRPPIPSRTSIRSAGGARRPFSMCRRKS